MCGALLASEREDGNHEVCLKRISMKKQRKNLRDQDCCEHCRYVFCKVEYDDYPQYVCCYERNRPKPCCSIAMEEQAACDKDDKIWMKFEKKYRVYPWMICDCFSSNKEPHWLTDDEIKNLSNIVNSCTIGDKPVVYYTTGWYFWDESWSRCYGPFITKKEADEECAKYASTL